MRTAKQAAGDMRTVAVFVVGWMIGTVAGIWSTTISAIIFLFIQALLVIGALGLMRAFGKMEKKSG